MRTLAIAAMGEPLTDRTLTGGRLEGPSEPARELWILAGEVLARR